MRQSEARLLEDVRMIEVMLAERRNGEGTQVSSGGHEGR